MNKLALLITTAIVAIFAATQVLFVVDEREFAMVRQLGEVVDIKDTPGLKWKLPFVQSVDKFSKQILTIDNPDADRFNTAENQPVLVDSFVKWQIADAREFRRAVGTDEVQAQRRISQVVNALLREEFGKRTLQEVVSGEREKIMSTVRERVAEDAKKIGVRIVDVRLKRVDLDERVTNAVFDRMKSERQRVASELRSTGSAEGERIRAEADKQREVILAEAYKKAQDLQGQGDAKAAAIYGAAYGPHPEFYSFYRSLDAYKASFKSKSDVMVLDPSADFFKFLKQPGNARSK
jgi:modulator of FtsH protease HflC